MSVTIEYELDPMFPDLYFRLFRNIFGRLMLVDDVVVNIFHSLVLIHLFPALQQL